MKYLLIISFIIAGHQTICHNVAQAGNWNNWDQWEKNKPNKQSKTPQGVKNYCSGDQEKQLLQLLAELDDPSLGKKKPGGGSEVRRKYRIARKLKTFDDCRAEDALKKLMKENVCEDMGEGEVFCVKWGASSSFQEVSSKKDLKKLSPKTPLTELLEIFKKYGPHPHKNDFASHKVMVFLIDQADANPNIYVPLLVEYFTQCDEILATLRRYPEDTTEGLKRCLLSPEPTLVWLGINLTRTLEKIELMGLAYDVSFVQKGNFDYSQQEDLEEIQTASLGLFRQFESNALPYYRGVLYGSSARAKEFLISGVKELDNPALRKLLLEFSNHLNSSPQAENSLLLIRLQKKLSKMGVTH